MKVVEGWSTHPHPDPEFRNVWADCPICNREEQFVLLADQQKSVVRCETFNDKNDAKSYIICYPHSNE